MVPVVQYTYIAYTHTLSTTANFFKYKLAFSQAVSSPFKVVEDLFMPRFQLRNSSLLEKRLRFPYLVCFTRVPFTDMAK